MYQIIAVTSTWAGGKGGAAGSSSPHPVEMALNNAIDISINSHDFIVGILLA
jgi:hypothetical protein